MTDHCCQCHEQQVAFVANISLAELAKKRKQTLSKLDNSSGRLCSLWFFQTSLKKLLEKTPQNRKKNACGLSSLSLHASSSTPNTWHSPLLQLKDTPLQASTPHITDLTFDGPPTKKCLDFSPADPTYDSTPKTTQRQSSLQQNASASSELPSLGVSLDDSRFSWTSSLATPPAYTAEDALPDEEKTELQEQMTKSKTLARALFSPDKEQSSLDGVGQSSTDISNAFKSCDKTPLAVNMQVLSPNIPFSPVLFESKEACAILSKHKPERCHHNPLSISLSTPSSSGDPRATIGDNKFPEEMSCDSLETPVSRPRTDCQLHSILSKKKHFSSTPKHVHFSELSLLASNCDKSPKNFSSADKLRQLRDSSASLSDLTLVTMQSECLEDSNDQKTISVNKHLSNVESCEANLKKDSFQVAGSQPDKGASVVETPLSVISKKQHDDNLDGESTTLAALTKMDPVAHKPHLNPNCKTNPRSPHCSKDESSIHPSFIQSSDIKPKFSDSTKGVLSVVPDISLNYNCSSLNSSGYVSVIPSTNENHNAILKSLSSEGLSSVGSSSNNQSCQMNPKSIGSPQLISSADISDNSQTLKKTKEFPEVTPQQPNQEQLTVSPTNKDDKNMIVFTQLSSSYNEKLINEVDQMLNRDLHEMSVIKHQIEQCPQTGDSISERRELDLDCSSLIDDEAKLSTQEQKDTAGQCSVVMPTDSPPGEKPVLSKETVSLSKTTLNNSDTTTSSSSSTPKVVISLCGKLRRKSKGFLYPTASQINHTSPLMAFNFKVQGMNDNKPDYVTKGTVDPSAAVIPDMTKSTGKSNWETDFKRSVVQDLESDTTSLVSKNTESSAKLSDFYSTTDKQHEMATMDPLPNKGNSQSYSQPEIAVDSSTNSIPVESPGKMAEGTEVASSNCEEQQETETMYYRKDSVHEPAQPSTTFQSVPIPDASSNPNNQSPIKVCQISDCQDTEIHRKTKFYRFQHKPKNLESEVPKVKNCESSRTLPFKSGPNSEILKQHATLSVVDSKSSELSKKTESNQPVSGSPDKELALIPDSSLTQNLKEAGNIIKESTPVQNDQEVLELNLLTASQMVSWEELDSFSEVFIEKDDDSSSLNILHSRNDQICSPDPGARQDNSKVEPKEESSDLAGGGKAKEEAIQNYQNTDITSKTQQQMQSVAYESHKLSSTENGNETKDLFPTEAHMTLTKREKENIEYLGKELDNKDLYLNSVSVHFNSPGDKFSDDKISCQKDFEGFCTLGDSQIKIKEVKHLSESEEEKNWTEDKTDQLEPLVTDCNIEPQVEKMDKKLPDQTDSLHPNNHICSTSPTKSKEKSIQSENKIPRNINPNFSNKDSRISNFKINQKLTVQNKQRTPNLKNSKRFFKDFRPFKAPRILTKYLTDTKSPPQQKYIENEKPESLDENHILKGFNTNSEKDNELQKIQNMGGISTARGKQISVKEESLKKAQNLLNEESVEAQSLEGFSTAGGKQISVKEESLKKAQNLLNEESVEAQSLEGFSTAGGKQISVKEESLKKAQNLLNEESVEAQSLGGFSTAGGKQISVKEESLKKAHNLHNEESVEAQSLGGFSTAGGKQISVKEESLKKAQNFLNEESVEAQSLRGFSTAGGKQISVNEESFKKAQNILNEESVEAQSLGGFSTARGKQISVNEESLKKAQNILNEESVEAQSLRGFSTVGGKQISVKEESLKKAHNLLNEESVEAQSLGGFSTARGKQISVKEESLKKAHNLLNEESVEAQSLRGFSTARGKQISVKEESLKKAQKILSEESVEAQSLGGFSTARGKQISVKEERLKKAQNLLNEESVEAQSLGGFSTARGKQIGVKEESLKKAQNLFNAESVDVQSLGGFSTARGKQISVKEESLKKAQNLLNEESVEAQSLGGFSTARGKQISVKEESLKKAQNLFNEEYVEAQSLGGFSTVRGKQISVKEESLKKAQNLNEESVEAQSLGSFSTARGKKVSVKEESLKKAENLLSEATLEPPIKSVKSVDSSAYQDEDVVVEIVDAMDENVVNDLLSTDFTPSQMNGGVSSSSKIPIDGDITSEDLAPVYSLARETEVASNYNHLIEDIFNCSWEDDTSTLSNITKKMQSSSVHPPNKLKRSVSEMTCGESVSTKKKPRRDDAENCSSLSVCPESSKNTLHVDKLCLLVLPIPNTELGKFSKSQDISDDVLMQFVKIHENQPGADSQIVSEDTNTESGCDSKDHYLNDSDCSNESEMALAVEKLEGEWKCSEISGSSTKQHSSGTNQMTDYKISSPSGDKANCPSDHSHHKFTPGNVKTCEVNSAIKPISGETFECSLQKNPTKSDLDTNNENCFHGQFKGDNKYKSCSYQNHSFELPSGKFPKASSGEASINQERYSATSKISSGFQTGLGQKVLVSNKSLQKAVEMLNSAPESRSQDVQPKTFPAFETGLGKKVHVSEKALHEAVKTLNKQTHCEEGQTPKETKPQTFIAFQTALGKDVPISEKSVNKARQILDAENPEKKDPTCSKAKYSRKETPYLGPAFHHKPEVWLHEDPQLDSDANSVPSTFKSLQHETNKINLLCQKQNSISWQPCLSTPEADRSGISPLFTDPVEILSDQSSGSKHHSFSDLISRNPLDIEQGAQEKMVEKNGQDVSSKKVDFKTPYRKTPAISEVQETVKVFPRISRPVFRGYRTLPNSPQEECQKYLNSNLMSSTTCGNFNNVKRQSDRLKDKEPCKENQMSRNFPCSSDSLSSHAAASNSDNATKKSHLEPLIQVSRDRNQNTNLLSTKSSVGKSSTFLPKSSHCKQFDKEISKKKVSSLGKTKLGLVPDDPGADGLSNKHRIPEIKENLPDQVQMTNQKEMQLFSQNAPCLVSSEEKSSRNRENVGKYPDFDKQSEPLIIESAENLCSRESHLEESRLEQDMIILRNKRKKILPQTGILTCRKASRKRIKLSDLLEGINVSSFLPEQFFASGLHPSTLAITSANAADYRFQLSAFYNVNCLHRIIIGDGAILVPDSKSTAGKKEFFRAFQTIEGVDPKLISPQWLFNHYRWIIWKLAAYEVALPQYFGGRCLYPEMVALQLKFRYDLEIDKCQRSALRKIIERDDTPAKRMVLCVSQINQELNTSTASPATAQPLTILEVTDGWYSTKLFLDCHLSSLVSKGKLRIGQKLCICNAEMVGSDTACAPLESPESVGLKVSGNCCRPAHWDAKLGFQADPRPLCLSLVQVAADGGLVSCVDVIVTRIYPVRYMEKVPGGGSVFRTSRAENRQEQRHEVLQQEAAEKLYNRLQASFESCFPKQGPKQCKNWSREEIQQLDNGQELYEAVTCALQPDTLLDCLSESQLVMLADSKRMAEELKAQEMKEEFQKAISNEEHADLKRNVTAVMKVRLVGCSHIDQQHKASTILTIWRPSEDLQQLLEEGQRYHIYNVMPSPARSFLSGLGVHLTLTRSTRFESLKRHPSIPQDLFHPRKVSSAAELQTKSAQENHLEVDVTGIVLRITKTVSANQRKLELLHAVDIEGNILTLRFWGGLQIFSVNDLLLEGVVFAGLNLLLRHSSPRRGNSIAILDVCSEVSHFSVNPHQDHLRDSINQLHKLKALEEFLVKSKEKLDSLLTSEKFSLILPKTPSTSNVCADSPVLHESDEAREKQKMLQQAKCAKLLVYGSGPSLSPMSTQVPSTVRKAFKPPSITKPKNN